jgi:probable HAF family extracellular repeat protein
MQDLGTLGGFVSAAFGVSADGAVTVGNARNAAGHWRAFRWTQDTGEMQDLGTLGGSDSQALGVSADGSVIVGTAQNQTGNWRAYLWTQEQGMQDLNVLCADQLSDGSVLVHARAVSADGRFIVGYGKNAATGRQEGFLLQWRE